MAVETPTRKPGRRHAPYAELRVLADRLPELAIGERREARPRILRRLRADTDPRAELDQRLLYPDVADRLRDPLLTVSLNYDRLAIGRWIAMIAAEDLSDTRRLQRLLYGLDALLRVQLWKENELFLAQLGSSSPRDSGR